MAPVTEKQKERFLDLCRKGMDRIEAARAVGEQASTFQILSLDDPEFRDQMKRALYECWRKRRIDYASELTHEVRQEFLELIRSGREPVEAAHAVGGYYWHFSRLCNVTGHYYDQDFHHAYLEAVNEGHGAFLDRIRSLIVRAAENGEYRAVRDLAIMHLPEGERLSSKKIEVRDGDLEALKQAALQIDRGSLTDDELAQLIRLHEKAAQPPQRLELVSGDA